VVVEVNIPLAGDERCEVARVYAHRSTDAHRSQLALSDQAIDGPKADREPVGRLRTCQEPPGGFVGCVTVHRLAWSANETPRNGQPRSWSHDALHRAELWLPVAGDEESGYQSDRSRPYSVYLPWLDPVHGEECVIGVGALNERHFERWLLPVGMSAEARELRAREALEALIEFDHTGHEWSHPPAGIRRSSRWSHETAQRRANAGAVLSVLLAEGLEAVEGQQLAEEELWVHLSARKIKPPSGSLALVLRVCEQCGLVFPAPRANRCPRCRRKPVRITLNPAFGRGVHTDYRADVTPDSRRLVLLGVCQACGRDFQSADPRVAHCANCRSGAGRVRRSRGSTTRGRQRWRFTNDRGDLIAAAGLEAEHGVIETDDAEAATRLRDIPGIIEVAY
jgi:predicted Zn-ribbon and HTH transcriptional regulator